MTRAQIDQANNVAGKLDQILGPMNAHDQMTVLAMWMGRQGVSQDDLDFFYSTTGVHLREMRRAA